MEISQSLTKNPSLVLAISIAVLYLLLTGLYQFASLPGKIAMPVHAVGELALLPLLLSLCLSTSVFLSWKQHNYFYLPLLINAITLSLLYLSWFAIGPTQISAINDNRSAFYSHTGVELPIEIHNVKEFDNTHDSPFGDGDAELSFQANQAELQQWMTQTGFEWREGAYAKNGDTLNQFTANNTVIFKDGPEIRYVVIDRTPKNLKRSSNDVSDSTTIFVNQTDGRVLVKDYDL